LDAMGTTGAMGAMGWAWLWLAAAGGLVVGAVAGVLLARRGRGEGRRLRELEEQLRASEDEYARYRSEVSTHFAETSERLRDLTLQYRTVYEHLAEGARRLCPEGSVALAPSLAEAALPAAATTSGADGDTAGAPEAEGDEAQLDLELEVSEPDEAAAAAHRHEGLEPILDEETPPPPSTEPEPKRAEAGGA
jgi:uncharacterized membrane-anchored protein YhcB (DUF1043 family)